MIYYHLMRFLLARPSYCDKVESGAITDKVESGVIKKVQLKVSKQQKDSKISLRDN